MVDAAGAPADHERYVDGRAHRRRQGQVVAGAHSVLFHAREQDLARAAIDAAARPGDGFQRGHPTAGVGADDEAFAPPAGVDARDNALAAEARSRLRQQARPDHGGAVDRNLVGARGQQAFDVSERADAAADGQRHPQRPGGALDHPDLGAALLGRRSDVEEDDLVGTLLLVAERALHRVPHAPQGRKADALDHAPVGHVQAGDHTPARPAHGSPRDQCTGPLLLRGASVSRIACASARPRAFMLASIR